jgi:acyl carrier protein
MANETVTREAVQTRVFAALEEFGADADEIKLEATFEELDVDSLDLVELGQIVQEDYGVEIKGEDMPKLKTVGDAVDLIATRAGA